MSFQIREAIFANMRANSEDEIRSVIDDAIARGEEHLLPGLGVFFEAYWKQADEGDKSEVLQYLSKSFAS